MNASIVTLAVLLGLGLFIGQASAQEGDCKEMVALDKQMDPSWCVCAKSSLRNVTVTPPPGTRLIAACSLRWSRTGPIDLSKTKITFDTFTDGDIPEGILYFAGELTLSGPITIQEDPEGNDTAFLPPWKVSRDGPLLLSRMTGSFYLSDESSLAVAQQAMEARKCSTGNVTMHVSGLQVVFGGNADGTTTALHPRFLKRSPLRACESPTVDSLAVPCQYPEACGTAPPVTATDTTVERQEHQDANRNGVAPL
jgi:hypothetical protein